MKSYCHIPAKLIFLSGGDAALTDDITADGQNGVSFIHPMGEIFLQPLAGKTQPEILHFFNDKDNLHCVFYLVIYLS